jgi:ubiquinone/menaquinone biosynthesis C-methylase UbiE
MNLNRHKQSFGKIAKNYQKYRNPYNQKLYKLLFSLIPNKDISVLDIGCGTGKSIEPLVKLGKKVKLFGCDPDKQMLKIAQQNALVLDLPITYIYGAAEKLPFDKNSFEVTISGSAFHWFANVKSLKEIRRVLKTKGMLFTFWSMYRSGNKTVGAEVYKKYNWKAVPEKLRDLAYISSIFKKSGLRNIKTIAIPYTSKQTIENYIGGLKTASPFLVLSSKEKIAFEKDIRRALKSEIKGKYYISKKEIRICYGFN